LLNHWTKPSSFGYAFDDLATSGINPSQNEPFDQCAGSNPGVCVEEPSTWFCMCRKYFETLMDFQGVIDTNNAFLAQDYFFTKNFETKGRSLTSHKLRL
jgi:hypothetical protein